MSVVNNTVRKLPRCECECAVESVDAITELIRVVNEIDKLHQPNWHDNSSRQPMWCNTCNEEWPCDTNLLLHPETTK